MASARPWYGMFEQQHCLGRAVSAELESQLVTLSHNNPIAVSGCDGVLLDCFRDSAGLVSCTEPSFDGPFSSTAAAAAAATMLEEQALEHTAEESPSLTDHLLSMPLSPLSAWPRSIPMMGDQFQQHPATLDAALHNTTEWAPSRLGSWSDAAVSPLDSPLSCDANNAAGLQLYSNGSSGQPWAAAASAPQLPHPAAPWRGPIMLCSPSPAQQLAAAHGSMAGCPRNPCGAASEQHKAQRAVKRRASSSSSEDSEDDAQDDEDYQPCAGSACKASSQKRKTKQQRVSQPKQPKGPRRKINYQYRGAARHKYTQQWESHIWDGQAAREPTKKTPRTTGKQVFLGTHNSEEEAARAYDRASLCINGATGYTNFPKEQYQSELDLLVEANKGDVVEALRSSRKRLRTFKQALLSYPCAAVLPHQALPELWEARYMRSASSYDYLGTFDSQEDAAEALRKQEKLAASS